MIFDFSGLAGAAIRTLLDTIGYWLPVGIACFVVAWTGNGWLRALALLACLSYGYALFQLPLRAGLDQETVFWATAASALGGLALGLGLRTPPV